MASDLLFIPLTAEALPVKGLTMIDSVVDEIKRCVNPDLDLGGVFFCRYNYRKLNHEVISKIQERYGDKVLKTIVRENISLAEMPMAGQTIFEYDAKSNGATDYMNLAKEILTKTN